MGSAMRDAIEKARMAGDLQQATDLLREAAKAGPPTIGLVHQLALTQMAKQEYGEAMESLLLIISKKPKEPQVWINIGQCAEALGDWSASLEAFSACARLKQGEFTARAHFGRGANLFRLGMHQWGVDAWKKALAIKPYPNESLFMRSQVTLAFGMWEEGWKLYESRRTNPGWLIGVRAHGVDVENLPPEWDGTSPGPVMCYAEQGAGDVLMFSRYLPYVGRRSDWRPLLACGPDMARISAYADIPIVCRHSVPLGSLPLLTGRAAPVPPCYDEWEKPSNPKPRIGVCWKGSPHASHDKDRSSPIDFREAFQDERWDIVSLQVGYDFQPKDYLETAELMRTLDAVVTVDTSNVHMAGTLGVPTIVIPESSPDWRWGLDGDVGPWYPSVKIVRRNRVNEWDECLSRAKRELVKMI